LVKVLPRQQGTKESRFMHLLSGAVAPVTPAVGEEASIGSGSGAASAADHERIAQLESEVSELRRELETLREQFASFQKQFQ
jgi:uncharacterized protein YceH (UPF0502 family)